MSTVSSAPRTAVCTIISKNYLHYARTLMASLRAVHPEWTPYVLLVDEVKGCFEPSQEAFRILEVSELPLPQPKHFFFRYSQLELNTAVKPWFLEWLFRDQAVDRVVYLDPDIFVYRRLEEVEIALDAGAGVVLTPHLTGICTDDKKPSERDILKVGSYNLGFVAVERAAAMQGLLPWWKARLEFDCRVDTAEGLFVDQRWMDLAPCLFDRVHVLRHEGYNVAYWNLAHRRIERNDHGYTVNGSPLTFFHFSGLDPESPEAFSKHQNRFRLADLGAVIPLVERYCEAVRNQGAVQCRRWPYAFGTWNDGTPIPDVARACFMKYGFVRDQVGDDPFQAPAAFLHEPWGSGEAPLITQLMRALWESRLELQRAFPDLDHHDRFNFATHFEKVLVHEARIPESFVTAPRASLRRYARAYGSLGARAGRLFRRTRQQLKNSLIRLMPEPNAEPGRVGHAASTTARAGFNLIGYLRSEHGVGESARLCAQAATSVQLPFTAHDFNTGNTCRTTDLSWEHRLSDEAVHGVTICHINADQMPRARAALGPGLFSGKYTIGFWHWEMAVFPDEWLPSFQAVNEVWVPTRFVHDAISRKSPVPVVRIPHGIFFQTDPSRMRRHLGLPEQCFLFLMMYDTQSMQGRKNPHGAIEAFRRAFPDPAAVGLVVKINNPASHPEETAALKAAIQQVPGVTVLDRILSRQEVYDLEGLCDCYVSLHRSEGFGLGLAESMFLGKPVIGTHYSGNVDFMNADNSCPVQYALVPLQADVGPYRRGQQWAEPDLDHAVWYMRRLVQDAAWRGAIAAKGRETIRTQFAPERVGRMYQERLRVLEAVRQAPASAA